MIKLIMAPLEGVTDKTFRSCYYDHFPGLNAALTPFLPIPDGVKRVPLRNLKQVALPSESPVHEIPQLLVSEPSAFLIAGRALERAGYREVNWNLGCPSRGVIRKGKGSGLMPHTDHILEILDAVLPELNINLSMKIRLGLESRDECFRLLPRLREYPISGLTLHPRLGTQMYSGSVDLDGFEKALELYGKPICYNGDIRSPGDFRSLKARFPQVEEWMIGRGLLADPFLAQKILSEVSFPDIGVNADEGADIAEPVIHPLTHREVRDFIDDLLKRMKGQFQREIALINYLKGILLFTFELESMPSEFRKELLSLKTLKEWEKFRYKIYEYFDSQ
ncbi:MULTISPECIES: tRNA-dihydrouridine synthase family protein [unclassified Oceanispirochaeta]|uniref:tRNA-dihydrouridine synthase family protein n=1 Tax=unclassified Oceanispirochaeta TaxID=2635722 RepID=UPI000E08F652|nr:MULTISPECIES: tRNA-dihydrouridine synthase family protein [unclassified Oceanispirochaeta]MBF9016435.1 tRNA-dihydrouridine synthase family protein [Oceanispirochaeta sp. M2]NPD72897.1 tRNA-dihydrouridine synthase family protein [Oceanispirochaeta sp. M1]RDG31474.1 tRNA-dihydrouridine synthase family protein [Oceanispirochaeta sp. M1]